MKKIMVVIIFLCIVLVACELDSESEPEPSSVRPYHAITFDDVSNTSSGLPLYRDKPGMERVVLHADTYRLFFQSCVERWVDAIELCVSDQATIEGRSASFSLEFHVVDDDFVVYDESIATGEDGFLCEIDHVDLLLEGSTESSFADFLTGIVSSRPSQGNLELSSFVRISDYTSESEYLGSSNPFSIRGSLSSEIGASEAQPRVSGSLDASFGSRIYSTVSEIKYGGKIISRLHIKPFNDVPYDEFVSSFETLVSMYEASPSQLQAGWQAVVSKLWGSGTTGNVAYELLGGDNLGELVSRTYTDLDAYKVLFLVDEVDW